jgi:hypothetical protein
MNALRFHENIIPLLGYCEDPRCIVTPVYNGDLYSYVQKQGMCQNGKGKKKKSFSNRNTTSIMFMKKKIFFFINSYVPKKKKKKA